MDGVDVPNSKSIEYREWETPYIRKVVNTHYTALP